VRAPWTRANEQHSQDQDQGETARVQLTRLDGDLQSAQLSLPGGEHKSHSYPDEYLVSGHTDSADSRPVAVDGAKRVQTRQALERASSINGAGGVHPDFGSTPRWTSAHGLPGLGRR
jgi:hypothetical protein